MLLGLDNILVKLVIYIIAGPIYLSLLTIPTVLNRAVVHGAHPLLHQNAVVYFF